MKKILLFLFLAAVSLSAKAQVIRYPYVQSVAQNSAIIAWRTSNSVLGSVKYGTDSTNLNLTAIDPGATTKHGILLKNLQQNTKYYYAIYSGTAIQASEYFFTAKDSTNTDFSFLQYGDCGYNNAIQKQVGALMEADAAEFAVVCGDIDQGGVPHISESEGGDNYDEIFFNVYNDGVNAKMLSRECHYTAIGNHDYYANNGAEYDNSFYLPHNNPENSERYYSFTWGDAKFIALDVITPFDKTPFPINFAPIANRWWTDFRVGSPQYEFLENELKCNDKKWVFIYFHEGPWTNYWGVDYNIPSAVGGDYYQFTGNVMVRNNLVPLFEKYNVDFVLNGHSHLYERGFKNGVDYVTSGSAGDNNVSGNILYANHSELSVGILENAYARFTVNDDSVYLQCINKDNNIIDEYTRTKTYVEYAVSSTVTNASCYQGNDGSVTVSVVGPKSPYKIEWMDNSDTTFTRTNLAAGTYFAFVKNKYNCEKVISITIEEPPMLVPQIVSLSGSAFFCAGDSINLATNNSYANYVWSTLNTDSVLTLSTAQTVIVDVVSAEGCVGTSAPFSVQYLAEPVAFFNTANAGFNYNFLAQNSVNNSLYTWSFGDGSADTSSTSNLMNHLFTAEGMYTVKLYASNVCGVDSFSKIIKIGNGGIPVIEDTTVVIDTIIPNPNSIFDLAKGELLSVSPNPFNTKSMVNADGFVGVLNVNVYDVKGDLVRSFKTSENPFYIEKGNLAAGNYFLKVEDKKDKIGYAKLSVY